MVNGSTHSREPINPGRINTAPYPLDFKNKEEKEEELDPSKGMVIIEVEILPIPPYRPHLDREAAKEPDLSHRITHRPPNKTLH